MDRPLYDRTDIEHLKTFTRDQVLEVFGSFEDRGLDESELAFQMVSLLDVDRVPGLDNALQVGDSDAIGRLVLEACKGDLPGQPKATDTDIREAEDVLRHQFKFYTETHQLPSATHFCDRP